VTLTLEGVPTAPPELGAAARRFEAVWPQWYVRYSVDRAPFRLTNLPSRLRHCPAYLTAETFIDVRAVHDDGTVRLDPEAYEALCWWDLVHPVVLFISDEQTGRWCLEPISAVTEWISTGHVEAVPGPGGSSSWAIPAELIFGAVSSGDTSVPPGSASNG
jgi:hypothetical protein